MKKAVILYDDSRIPERMIRNITGNKSFGEMIYKRRSLKDRAAAIAASLPSCLAFYDGEEISSEHANCAVIKLYSGMVIADEKAFAILVEKSLYAKECYQVTVKDKTAAVIYPDAESFRESEPEEESRYAQIVSDAFLDVTSADAFRRFITGGFDSRFFNELSGDDHTVIKHSANVEKLRREYAFYGLLPEEMKMWFAMPFSYREEDGRASYTMERYHMTDLAIRYVHGAISPEEFRAIMEKLFYFISTRVKKAVSAAEYEDCADELYIKKVERRIGELKQHPLCARLNRMLSSGSEFEDIDAIFAYYRRLYEEIRGKKQFEHVLVVGHGDLCFSNILYSHDTSFMKLIDPKGAECEEQLYTDPFYDLAKLSHSVCGAYDFFNSDLFEIYVDDKLQLSVKTDGDNELYIRIFREFLDSCKLDYRLIRLYEASLFLSMLPLHIDREKKVLGFLLNAIRILKGIENG